MDIKKRAAVLLVFAAAAACRAALDAPGPVGYATSCVVVDADSVDGYVTNQGRGTDLVVGPVQFIFSGDGSMSRPAIETPANTLVPAGQTALVAHVKLAFEPLPGEACRFEVKDALRASR